ncbi:hypothetical protein DPMN_071842 [Dreissena polymorpha]|uniref:Uncharacterized protein n=1 Tax=Dreissena polymorpha TaxID=45954 RepID=A0A9D3Z314_DREPO|nr:hypothetical protein DPMN_071842 [Dreissena polymorpha]
MGYQQINPKTPGRRPLIRRPLEESETVCPKEKQPVLDIHSETPLKHALTDEDTLPCKMVASKILDFSLNEQCIDNEQCVSVCCQKYPDIVMSVRLVAVRRCQHHKLSY